MSGGSWTVSKPPRPPVARPAETSEYAKRIYDQLRKDRISPPPWPPNPGDPSQRAAMEKFRADYKKYCAEARKSLMRAGLIDDPDKPKKLSDAIVFKGICEDMCPELEKITRIVEHDVKREERSLGPDGLTALPDPSIMVKALARSAAGQDAPLPMEIRSTAALRRTLDYLIDDLLQSDANLPLIHNFLWDRTRAIRRDFVFHSTMSNEELMDQVYCLENITRFHVTALHILSQKGLAADDFSERQEIEQLGKSLLSLKEAYDDCRVQGVTCENEAEFRAYYVLLNTDTPNILETVQEWDRRFWTESDELRTAVSLVEAMQNVWDQHGPVKPAPNVIAMNAFSVYFSIVESRSVSYTMACFAEIHFNRIRRGIMKTILAAYSRVRDRPKDLTLSVLNKFLRFDTEDDAKEFIEQLGLTFIDNDAAQPYLLVDSSQRVGSPTLRQSFSRTLVERKRSGQSLAELIHTTVYEKPVPTVVVDEPKSPEEESLFVKDSSVAESPKTRKPASPRATTASPWAAIPSPAIPGPSAASPPAPQPAIAPPALKFPAEPASGPTASSVNFPSVESASIFGAKRALSDGKGPSSTVAFDFTSRATTASKPLGSSAGDKGPIGDLAVPKDTALDKAKDTQLPSTVSEPSPQHGINKTLLSKPSQPTKQPEPSTTALPKPAAAPTPFFTPAEQHVPKPAIQEPSTAPTALKPASPVVASSSSLAQSKVSKTQSLEAPKLTSPPKPKIDRLTAFTNWYVLGDHGLVEEFMEAMVEKIVTETYAAYQRDEDERREKEEAARDLEEARKYRIKSLSVKYFYRWRDNAFQLGVMRRGRENREKVAAYYEAQRAASRASRQGSPFDLGSVGRRRQRTASLDVEDALLATGILTGLRNERETAARIVQDAKYDMPPPAVTPKKKRPLDVIKSGLSESVGKVKESAKLRRLREQFEAGAGSLRRSLPPGMPFSQKWSASPPPPEARRKTSAQSNVKTDYFRLKARGLVLMPDGTALHESLASRVLNEGKRLHGMGNFGLPSAAPTSHSRSSSIAGVPSSTAFAHLRSDSTSSSTSPFSAKRKRDADEDGAVGSMDGRLQENGQPDGSEANAPPASKRKLWSDEEEKLLREVREAREQLMEGERWYREQTDVMSRGGTPWGGSNA